MEIKTKTITVENSESKSGVKNNNQWTLTKITDQDKMKFKTFNGGLYMVGGEYEIKYTEELKDYQGTAYYDRMIQDNVSHKQTGYKTPAERALAGVPLTIPKKVPNNVEDEDHARLARIEELLIKVAKFIGAEL